MTRRTQRALAFVALFAVVSIVCLGIVGWRQSQRTPAWWAPADATQPGVEAVGKTLETTLVNEAHKLRSDADAIWAMSAPRPISSCLSTAVHPYLPSPEVGNHPTELSPTCRQTHRRLGPIFVPMKRSAAAIAGSARRTPRRLARSAKPKRIQ